MAPWPTRWRLAAWLAVLFAHCQPPTSHALRWGAARPTLARPAAVGAGHRRSSARRSCVRCHFGHSHGHHEHDHGHGHSLNHDGTVAAPATNPLLSGSSLRIALVAAGIALAPPRRSKTKLAAAVAVAATLVAVERGRSFVRELRWRVSTIRRGFLQHQAGHNALTPQVASSPADASTAENSRAANRITWIGVVVNLLLAGLKLAAGIWGHSAAMIADAGHSLSDLLSDGVTLWAVQMARLPPDADHPYGHGRFEAVGAFMIALLLIGASLSFGIHAYDQLVSLATVTDAGAVAARRAGIMLAMGAAVVSILSKEILYRATAKVGQRINSQVLIANAWHHRSDALSSIVALVGIAGASLGVPALDPIAGLCVAGMVTLTGLSLSWDAVMQLTDTADTDTVGRAAELARTCDGVVAVHEKKVRARRMGSDTLVDVLVEVAPHMSSSSASHVAETVRWAILEGIPNVTEVLVHVVSEAKQCPMLASLRSAEAIEADVRAALRGLMASPAAGADNTDRITAVHRVTVHYIQLQPCVEVVVDVAEDMPVSAARAIAQQVRLACESVDDVVRGEVHLFLGEPANHDSTALITKGPKREMV